MTEIVLDCDPGHDDAIALLLAGAAPELDVAAVTTVAGNQTLEKTTDNARRMLTVMDRPDIPVAAGMGEPLARELTTAAHVHGESGLDGPDLPAARVDLDDRHGVDLLIDTVRASDGITLVPVGPLTNIAMALKKAPDIRDGIEEIVVMGGAIRKANITPAAEFNIYVDPEAARYVFESGLDVTMVGLDVTFASQVRPAEVETIRGLGEVGSMVAAFLDFAAEYYTSTHGLEGYPIHDAVAVAHVLDDVVETERMRVDVETDSEFCDGRTVCDVDDRTDRSPNVDVGVDLDREAFLDRLLDSLEAYE
ncbi:MAG: nucleoside hydrolase [Halobacteriaceae archaeon]